jgi:hypothetical protein
VQRDGGGLFREAGSHQLLTVSIVGLGDAVRINDLDIATCDLHVAKGRFLLFK